MSRASARNESASLLSGSETSLRVIDDGKLILIFCPTGEMLADTLTKALPSPKVKHFASELGLRAA